jgi:hypothetical protein
MQLDSSEHLTVTTNQSYSILCILSMSVCMYHWNCL